MLKPYGVPIERLNRGKPIVAPKNNWWENEATINAAAFYLERSATNDPIIKKLISVENLDDLRLENGIVTVHYRALSKRARGKQLSRSYVGLALFTPEVELLKRYPEPLILPSENPEGYDYLGVEDVRITRIGDTFYALYCGFEGKNMRVCMAISKDLTNWEKLGLVRGDINSSNNKDAVLFPEKIDGHYFMMHCPMVNNVSNFSIHLAMSNSPIGVWKNYGTFFIPLKIRHVKIPGSGPGLFLFHWEIKDFWCFIILGIILNLAKGSMIWMPPSLISKTSHRTILQVNLPYGKLRSNHKLT